MVDNGNEETRPKLTLIEGGKGKAGDEGLSYEGIDEDLKRIGRAAKLKPNKEKPNVHWGHIGDVEITIERHVDLGTARSVTLGLIYPATNPDLVLEGFTVRERRNLTDRYSHTETLRGNPEPAVTRGLEAEPKIKATIRKVKQIAGIIRIEPQTSS